jgi:hypothetical protein
MKSKTLTLLKPAVVLTAICLAAALLLSAVNHFTAPIIEQKEQEKYLATLGVVLPEAEGFEEIKLENAPKTVKAVYKETSGKGYALLMQAASGYHTLEFSLGIDAQGKIAGISMTSTFHSGGDSGLGKDLPAFLDSFKGVGEDLKGSADKVTNATKSSAAMRAAMADAFALVETLKGGAEK